MSYSQREVPVHTSGHTGIGQTQSQEPVVLPDGHIHSYAQEESVKCSQNCMGLLNRYTKLYYHV